MYKALINDARAHEHTVTDPMHDRASDRGGVGAAFRPIVLAFPGGGDQYTDCFYPELSEQGAIVRPGQYAGRWLLRNVVTADFAHFHWPSMHYAAASSAESIRLALKFAVVLLGLRLCGVRILWTAHNLYPHERTSPKWLDYAVRMLLCRVSACVFAHGNDAAHIILREFNIASSRVVVIDHGNFLNCYPRQVFKKEARRHLGLPEDAFVYLFFGQCRRYKNVHKLIDRFQTDYPARDSYLLIIGQCADPAYREQIEEAIRRRPDRIVFEPRFIPGAEVQYYFRSADAVVLPFEDVLTSGSAILALSFGRPVVAPRLGYLTNVVLEDCGILYDVKSAHGLSVAMREVRSRCFDEAGIEARASALRWDESAAIVLRALRGVR